MLICVPGQIPRSSRSYHPGASLVHSLLVRCPDPTTRPLRHKVLPLTTSVPTGPAGALCRSELGSPRAPTYPWRPTYRVLRRKSSHPFRQRLESRRVVIVSRGLFPPRGDGNETEGDLRRPRKSLETTPHSPTDQESPVPTGMTPVTRPLRPEVILLNFYRSFDSGPRTRGPVYELILLLPWF